MSVYFAGVSLAMTAVTTVAGAEAQQDAAESQANNAFAAGAAKQYQGYLDQELQTVQANDIKKQTVQQVGIMQAKAIQLRSALVTAQGASGVMIGDGSALAAEEAVEKQSAGDVMAAIGSAINKESATRTGARFAGEQGDAALQSGAMTAMSLIAAGDNAATGTVLSGLGSMISTAGSAYYKSNTPGTLTTRKG